MKDEREDLLAKLITTAKMQFVRYRREMLARHRDTARQKDDWLLDNMFGNQIIPTFRELIEADREATRQAVLDEVGREVIGENEHIMLPDNDHQPAACRNALRREQRQALGKVRGKAQ